MTGKVDSTYPKPHELINNEHGTLQFIVRNKFFQEHFPDLHSQASLASRGHKKDKSNTLDFQSNIGVASKTKSYTVHIGANIKSNGKHFEMVSYSLCISSDSKIIRRFHLDYALPGMAKAEISPIFHLQYGGKTKDSMSGHTSIIHDEELDLPKIFNLPMTLAILLHLVLTSFPDTDMRKFVETPEWKKLLIENETTVYKPFFERCNELITHSKSSKTSFFEECYYHPQKHA